MRQAKTIIIGMGTEIRRLGLNNENKYIGHGLSYTTIKDADKFAGKTVAVIGGGNSALQEAILLSDLAKKVYVVQNLDTLTGEVKLREQLYAKENVEIILGTVVKELLGDSELVGIKVENANNEVRTLDIDGMFVAIGLIPQNEPFAEHIALNAWGYADSAEDCKTSTEGIFVAGDCRSKRIRQVATAAADGAIAALAAVDYIDAK